MDSRVVRLFLIRHAETEWNNARIFQGHLDSTVTSRGLEQAAELAKRLASEGIAAVYSSDQNRSVQTAQAVASRLGLPVIPRAELREIDTGDWTGMSYQDARAQWPDVYDHWKNRPDLLQMPGGESVVQVQQRALRFIDEVRLRHVGQTVCVVTHNTVVRAILCHLLGWPLARLWEGPRQPNCAINLIEFRDGKADILEMGNASYLADAGPGATSMTI